MIDVDVLVVGAGPAGCATAITLAPLGVSVLLVGGFKTSRTWSGESLPSGAGQLVASLFGPDILRAPPHQVAFGTRAVWGSDQLLETDFLANPLGHGWQLDRSIFDAQLRQSSVHQGVDVLEGLSLRAMSRQGSFWNISLTSGEVVHARWLVDASGRAGVVMRHLRIRRNRCDRQIALIARVADSESTDAYFGTTVEAAAEGWWYITPLPGGGRVLAYLTDSDLMAKPAERQTYWKSRLSETNQIQRLAGSTARDALSAVYPAETSYRQQLYGEGWVAVGDAAVTLDPLSSQGVVTALLMGARAGHAVAGNLADGQKLLLDNWQRDYRLLLQEHEAMRAFYAAAENRWPDSVYWGRRTSQPVG